MFDDLMSLTDDELCGELRTWSARVAVGEAYVLRLVGELDRREAWGGFLSCAHWLSHWLGLGLKAARERVRIARALRDLPLIEAALGSGRMSYAQIRAVTRVAGPDQQELWEGLAGQASGGDVLDAGRRRDQGEASAEACAHQPARATFTDGLLELVTRGGQDLAREQPRAARRHRMRLAVQVDPLSGCGRLADGELLAPAAVARLGTRPRVLSTPDLAAADQGRSSREPSDQLRDLLVAVDGQRCRFPGCTRHRRLHAHHVRWWVHGGRTDLGNMLMLCGFHHRLVHREHWQLTLRPGRRLEVRSAEGTRLHHHPRQPEASAEALPARGPDDLHSARSGQPLDLHYAVSVIVRQAD